MAALISDRLKGLSGLRSLALAGVTALALSIGSSAGLAQDAGDIDPDAVIATVNGLNITEADLGFAAEDLAEDLAQIPPQAQRAYLVSVLIDMKLMSGAARSEGLEQTAEFARRAEYLEERALRRAYFVNVINAEITDETIRQAYDEYIAKNPAGDEVRARHILVETEAEAQAIIAELDGGADFATLAQEQSTGPSGQAAETLVISAKAKWCRSLKKRHLRLKLEAFPLPCSHSLVGM